MWEPFWNTWKQQSEAEHREIAEEAEKNGHLDPPENLKPHLVTGVTNALLTSMSPIDKLKMKTRHTKIHTHTVDDKKGPGRGDVTEKTPDGRPLSATWYPVKEKGVHHQ